MRWYICVKRWTQIYCPMNTNRGTVVIIKSPYMKSYYRHFSGLVSREISSFNHAWFFHIYMISISALILIGSSLRGRYQPSSWLADTVGRDVPASIFDISPRAVILIGPSLRGRYPPSFWLADTVGRDVPASICITKQSARGCQNTRSITVFFQIKFPSLSWE